MKLFLAAIAIAAIAQGGPLVIALAIVAAVLFGMVIGLLFGPAPKRTTRRRPPQRRRTAPARPRTRAVAR